MENKLFYVEAATDDGDSMSFFVQANDHEQALLAHDAHLREHMNCEDFTVHTVIEIPDYPRSRIGRDTAEVMDWDSIIQHRQHWPEHPTETDHGS